MTATARKAEPTGVTLRDVMTDAVLFGEQFGNESWTTWRALLCAFYGLALNREERRIFQSITGRAESPQEALAELWLVVGRRGGKSQCAALLAVYEAAFRDHTDRLAPGEVATVAVLAADRKQARAVFRYVSGLLRSNPMLERLIAREDREAIELTNRAVIEITTASYRQARGYTFGAVIADEVAFWRSDDSANPDHEILNAVRPGLATLGGPLICLSSPYARRGELWETYRRHYGKASGVLVAQADSRTMNPGLPERVVADAYERDPQSAAAEYGAQFRTDVETFLTREAVDSAVRTGPMELLPDRYAHYHGFTDPAGGGADEYTLAIGHRDGDRVVIDCLRARKGEPAAITAEFADIFRAYGLRHVTSDKYAGSWPADEFARHGITVEQSAKPKSDLYRDALAAFNSCRVEIPADDRLVTQLVSLERRTARGGRDSIDHPPGGHDDRANACAGLIAKLSAVRRTPPLKDWL